MCVACQKGNEAGVRGRLVARSSRPRSGWQRGGNHNGQASSAASQQAHQRSGTHPNLPWTTWTRLLKSYLYGSRLRLRSVLLCRCSSAGLLTVQMVLKRLEQLEPRERIPIIYLLDAIVQARCWASHCVALPPASSPRLLPTIRALRAVFSGHLVRNCRAEFEAERFGRVLRQGWRLARCWHS